MIVLLAAGTTMIFSAAKAGVIAAVLGLAAWLGTVNDYRSTPSDTISALRLLLTARDAPAPSVAMRKPRAESDRFGTGERGCRKQPEGRSVIDDDRDFGAE